MKSKNALCGLSLAVVLHLGLLAGSAQTNKYLFSGSETNITLNPGTYVITAYGAPGGNLYYYGGIGGGLGAEMSAEFRFSASTTLTLLVGGGGGYAGTGGGGGGSFVVEGGTPLIIAGGGGGGGYSGGFGSSLGGSGNVSTSGGSGVLGGGAGGTNGGGGGSYASGGGGGFLGNGGSSAGTGGGSFVTGGYGGLDGGGYGGGGGAFSVEGDGEGAGGGGFSGGGGGDGGGGGGGSIIDSSEIAILNEVSGIASPEDSTNGEIIIIALPAPLLAITTQALFGFTNGVFGFNVIGPSGSNVVIQASTDLQTWIPLQTNLLGSGPLYFSDSQSTTNTQRFYRAQLSP